jgi:5-methylthioadenosine/S-adenosylhomocysteine deaminase
MDIWVRNGHVYTNKTIRKADVGIRNGTIEAIGEGGTADRTIDATGCLVLPGLINAHTHSPMTLLRGYADDLPLDRWLRERIWPIEAHLEPADIYAGARLAVLEMIRTGTTAFCDMYFAMDEVAEVVKETGIRGVLGRGLVSTDKDRADAQRELERGVEFVRNYDGTANGRIRSAIAPHAPYSCADWLLEAAAESAADLDCLLHTHLNETADEISQSIETYGRRPTDRLDEHGCWENSALVAHGVHLDDEAVGRLGDQRVCVAHCPTANMKLASGAAPIAEMNARGITVCLGTDGAASNNTLDMFTEMRHAALLAKLREADSTVLPPSQVLAMATRNGGRALGLETGVVAEGWPADLAIVDLEIPHLTPRHDLLSHSLYAASGQDVCTTIVDGRVLMEDGEVLTVNEDEVLAEAKTATDRLLARAEGSD